MTFEQYLAQIEGASGRPAGAHPDERVTCTLRRA